MSIIYSIIYSPKINWLLRNINYILAPLLPEKIKIHPSGFLKVRIDGNNFFTLRTNQTSYVTRQLFWNKASNYEYTDIFIELSKNSRTFLDIGASIGYYSILSAKVNSSISVHSFEPSPGSMVYLSENARLNNLEDRIKVHVIALSDKTGKLDFFQVYNKKYPNTYNLSGEHNVGTKPFLVTNRIKVDSITLDNFVENNEIKSIDLIKLDTEGCEDAILKNALNVINAHRPIIICETLYNRIEGNLEDIMKPHNYSFYNHKGHYLEEVISIKRDSDNGVRNCFFVPNEKKEIVKEFLLNDINHK